MPVLVRDELKGVCRDGTSLDPHPPPRPLIFGHRVQRGDVLAERGAIPVIWSVLECARGRGRGQTRDFVAQGVGLRRGGVVGPEAEGCGGGWFSDASLEERLLLGQNSYRMFTEV